MKGDSLWWTRWGYRYHRIFKHPPKMTKRRRKYDICYWLKLWSGQRDSPKRVPNTEHKTLIPRYASWPRLSCAYRANLSCPWDYEMKRVSSYLIYSYSMNMTILLITLLLLFISLSGFLLKELFKKFWFWKDFQKKYKNQTSWIYNWDKKPGMYTIKMEWNKAFNVLIGFDFSLGPVKNIGYDIFWYMESSDEWILYFSTYLPKWWVEFLFLIENDCTENIQVSLMENNSLIKPDYTFDPHWWQKLDLF